MMEATPSASFIMPEPDLLLELLIIAFDAPAQLGGVDQIAECDAARQGRKPILGRLLLALGPLDQQPFIGCLPPLDGAPSAVPQSEGEVLDRDRIGRVTLTLLRCAARPLARLPHQHLRLNAGHIALSKLSDTRAQL